MNNLKIPAAILTFLAAQLGGAIWWSSQIDARVEKLENESLTLARENRRYIQEVIMPSYEISDSWNNPYHNNWVRSGGWKNQDSYGSVTRSARKDKERVIMGIEIKRV